MNSTNPRFSAKDDAPHLAVSIVLATIATACFLLGLGNACVLIRLYHRPQPRRVSHYLLANLSASSLLASSTLMPVVVVTIAAMHLFDCQRSVATDLIWSIAWTIALGVRILYAATLSLMALDREDCVLRPFRRRLSHTNIRKVIFAIWIFAALLAMPSSVPRLQETSASNPFSGWPTIRDSFWRLYNVCVGTFIFVVTLMIITITFVRVLRNLRTTTIPLGNISLQILQRREYRIKKLAYCTCAVFVLSWLPVILVFVFVHVVPCGSTVTGTIRLFTMVLSNLNYALNPFLNQRIFLTRPKNRVLGGTIKGNPPVLCSAKLEKKNTLQGRS